MSYDDDIIDISDLDTPKNTTKNLNKANTCGNLLNFSSFSMLQKEEIR